MNDSMNNEIKSRSKKTTIIFCLNLLLVFGGIKFVKYKNSWFISPS
jgi:hypothetical protein